MMRPFSAAILTFAVLLSALVAVSCNEPERTTTSTTSEPSPPTVVVTQPKPAAPPSAGEESTRAAEEPIAKTPPKTEDAPRVEEPAPTKPVESRFIQPFPDVRVNLATREVQFAAIVCLNEGWLEQIVCSPNTREHETLMVTEVRPSNLHAAMLLAKYEAGTPGRWKYEDDRYSVVPPTGTAVQVLVRYTNAEGEVVEHPVHRWVRDHRGESEFPDRPWVFGGSRLAPNPESMGPGEHYVADMTGSVIGLVTFGDELLGWRQVLSDQAAVSEPEWEANGRAMPPIRTPVTVILRPVESGDDAPSGSSAD